MGGPIEKLLFSGGGGDVTVEQLTVDQSGTITAPEGKAYSPVVVPEGSVSSTPTITASGGTITASVTPTVNAGWVASAETGTASAAATALDANLVAGNIKEGVTIFGVTGTLASGRSPKAEPEGVFALYDLLTDGMSWTSTATEAA